MIIRPNIAVLKGLSDDPHWTIPRTVLSICSTYHVIVVCIGFRAVELGQWH